MRGKVGGGPGVGRDRNTRAKWTGKGEGSPPARGCALRGKVGGGPSRGKMGKREAGSSQQNPKGNAIAPGNGGREALNRVKKNIKVGKGRPP